VVLSVVLKVNQKAKPSFVAKVLVVERAVVVVGVPGLLPVRKTIAQSKAEYLRA
jgi:hypothetical protein